MSSVNILQPIDTSFTFKLNDDLLEGRTSPHADVIGPPTAHSTYIPLLKPITNFRPREEARKLLSHVLFQLANRRKPVPVWDALIDTPHIRTERSLGNLPMALKGAVKGIKSETMSEGIFPSHEDDSDDEQPEAFTTDETINLVIQLEDVLATSISQGWQIFDDSNFKSVNTAEEDPKLTFRLSRSSGKTGGKRSRSTSPNRSRDQLPELLSLCIYVLGSIVAEDCRYRVALPRPSRPPNSLQVLTLNIAQFLAHTHATDSKVMSQISFAMIPAFSTFEPQMHSRLLAFFESSIIRPVLSSLKQLQESMTRLPLPGSNDPFDVKGPLAVSIKIEEVMSDDDRPLPSSSSITAAGQIQSTNHPHQSQQIYHLAFIFSPLLSAILDSADAQDANGDFVLSSHLLSLLAGIADSKPDIYTDLLEIVAFRGPKARRLAIACLANLWSRAVGHSIISGPFLSSSQHQPRKPSSTIHIHQFYPWFSASPHGKVHTNDLLDNCRSCSKLVTGFCLRCPLCVTCVHADCYDFPDGNFEVQYSMAEDPRLQRIGMHRFSHLQSSGDPFQGVVVVEGHCLRATNWFTLCLCVVCHQPLWGCYSQGLRCEKCSVPVHFACHSSFGSFKTCGTFFATSNDVAISWEDLRRSCLDHFPILRASKEQLHDRSREEISVYRDALRTQLQILDNGVMMGSLVILGTKTETVPEFEVHNAIELCRQLLDSGLLRCGPLTEYYRQHIDSTASSISSVLFDQSYLEYVTASIKSSYCHHAPSSSNFLNVERLHVGVDDSAHPFPYECVRLSHVRDVLAADFAVRADDAALLFINHLHQLALFDRRIPTIRPFNGLSEENDVECIFPLPLGIDLSLNVEILVSAIESCLADLDLTTNEFGFLLLVRRFWPSGLASEQVLTRLAGKVLTWILDEDEKLAVVLREYVAKRSNLPGMRTPGFHVWPVQPDSRQNTSLASNGGDFVTARRLILSRYALPWLLEFHDLDPDLYDKIAFQSCLQMAEDKDSDIQHQLSIVEQVANRNDELLRGIIKLYASSVVFTAFDGILLRSIQQIDDTDIDEKPSSLIYRLFSNETEATSRASTFVDLGPSQNISSMDSVRVVLNLAQQSAEGLSQTLRILPVFVKSGITISSSFFSQILECIESTNTDFLEQCKMLTRSITFSLWLRSFGRQDLQPVIASLHARLSTHISDCLITRHNISVALSIIQYTLASCLLIYGCERSSIMANKFVSQSEMESLPSRRRIANIRGTGVEDPIYIEPAILSSLQLYMESNIDDISCLTAKFLHLFIVESRFLEAFEFDNFIVRNAKLMAVCVWKTYNIQRDDLATVRTHLLVRHLLIDAQPLEEILSNYCDHTICTVEQRLSAVNRLFRMVADVTSPAFAVEGRQWRSSVIEIFHHYFAAMWLDPSEEVRLAVKVSSAALLPAHLDKISQCWDESFSKSPVTERVRLVGFLIQLRQHFTSWKVLSWETLIDTLAEYDGLGDHMNSPTDAVMSEKAKIHQLTTVDPDMDNLRASVLHLSLQMLGDGITIDNFSLMKLKVQFVRFMGFSNISVIPTSNSQSFYLRYGDIGEILEPCFCCIEELVHVVDSPHFVELPHSALGIVTEHDEKAVSVLVGAIFVDATMCIVCTLRDLTSLPVLTLKSLLESLYIIIQKYDFEDSLFRHLQPLLRRSILRIVGMLSKDDVSYELRLLALTIAQTTIKRFYAFLGSTIPVILDIVTTEVADGQNSQDPLSVQGKHFIGTTLHAFCQNGLLTSMMKRPLHADFFRVLKNVFVSENLDLGSPPALVCEALLRDTLLRVADVESALLHMLLQNIGTFIEEVYCQGYSVEMIIFTGQQLTQIARRMSDGTIEGADPSPLIIITAILLLHNRNHLKEFIPYIDTVLRTSLNRLNVDASTLGRLIRAALSTESGSNDTVNILFEILIDGLRMKTKMASLTINSLIEALLSADLNLAFESRVRGQHFQNLVDNSFIFLQNHDWTEEYIEDDFKGVTAAATLFLNEASRNGTVFQKFVESPSEKIARFPLSFRSWNILLLVALQEAKEDWGSMLLSHFHAFNSLFIGVMRSYATSGIGSLMVATSDVNQSHIALKLWLMLCNSTSQVASNRDTLVTDIWNELWYAYEGFLDALETEAQVGLYPTLVSLATTSVADLVLYIHSLRMPMILDKHTYVAILNRLKIISKGDSPPNKILRAMQSLSEPPSEIPREVLLTQIAKELVAAEKIRIMESKGMGDNRMIGGDRLRKDGKY